MAKFVLTFKPGITTEVEIDDHNLLFYAEQQKTGQLPQQNQVIENALDNPIHTPQIRGLIKPDDKILIIVDDFTRPTPSTVILPLLLERIHEVGVPISGVTILVAAGTHRPMTDGELAAKLGMEVYQRYRVINHDYIMGSFINLGHTESGTPIEINEMVVKADFRIAVGNVVPHVAAGWGGGSKLILPGVCSYKTTEMMHLMACTAQSVLEVIGNRNTKARHEMDAIAAKVGLDFIVNTILDEKGNVVAVFAGHFIEAHKAACNLAEKLNIIPIPAQADIVIVSANPCHFDYWQGLKPYVYSHLAVRENGIIIFLLDGAEGLCGDAPTHEETLRKYLPWSFEDQKAAVNRGEVKDLIGIHAAMYHSQVQHRVKKTFCVTNHLSLEDIAALGFDPAPSVQEALKRSYDILGQGAKVGVIPNGGETIVHLAPNEV